MNEKRKLTRKELAVYKETLKLSQKQRDIIVGTLLGDSTIALRLGKCTKMLKFEQGQAHKEYVVHLHDIFKDWCGGPPQERFIDKTRKAVWFRTYAHDSFLFYFNAFYTVKPNAEGQIRSTKFVPKTIKTILTARAIAYWFMDDGSKHPTGFYLNSHGFSYEDHVLLQETLASVHKISTSIQKDKEKFRINVLAPSKEDFENLVRPYIHSDFLYKLHNPK